MIINKGYSNNDRVMNYSTNGKGKLSNYLKNIYIQTNPDEFKN